MSLKRRFLRRILPPALAFFLRMLLATVRVRELGRAERLPGIQGRKRLIFAFWHNEMVPVVGYYAGRDIQSMASRSFDGEVIADTLIRLGYPAPTRGSSSNNGRQALKALARGLREGRDVVLTPDGPMGPRHKVQSGVLTLARLTGYQLVPLAFRCRPVIKLGGWDRMEIPLPFAKGCAIFANPITVPRECSEEEMDALRDHLEETLRTIDEQAVRLLSSRAA